MRMPATFHLPLKGGYKPIGGYGAIGNTRTVALVGFDGSIDWCCLPRFDSPSVFAALLDRKKGGRWTIQPESEAESSQRYLHDTNILLTEFKTSSGQVTLTDFMPCSIASEAWSTPPEIHRIVQCVTGEMDLQFVFQPVFNYGLKVPRFARSKAGLSIRDTTSEMVLSWSVPFEPGPTGAEGKFHMAKDERRTFVLSYGEATPRAIAEYQTERQRARTEVFWLDWVGQLRYRGRWRDIVIRSALALKLLVYTPTGAIVAAPTTSLPESIKGGRNWDYRYSWIRDSASSIYAFHLLGYKSETEAYLHWLIDNNPALDLDLRLMYDVAGNGSIEETRLSHLEGYMGSKPVRIGNAASKQLQLDAYGYMLDALYFSSRRGSSVSEEMYFRFVKPLANYIVDHWGEPGNGIWEIRSKREHYVYTKGWCWAGLDRAVKIAKACGHEEDAALWSLVKEKIKAEVTRRGWSRKKQSFVMHYGSEDVDASTLMLPLIGFIRADDEKMRRTIEAIKKELATGALVYRYKTDDGMKGKEGAFLLCGFWLVACLARLGQVEEAMTNLNELVERGNHLGLFSEEVDPTTGEALGNFPQAFSHTGLILAASTLDRVLDKHQE